MILQRRSLGGVVAAVMLAVALSAPVRAQAQAPAAGALDLLPADADVAFVVPSLADLNHQLALVKQSLGLPMTELDDVLSLLKRETGLVQGIRDAGSALVVLPDVAEAIEAGTEPAVLLVLPVSDAGAFMTNFVGTGGAVAGVTPVTLRSGHEGFVKMLDRHAVLGETQAAVADYVPAQAGAAVAESLGGLGQRYLGESDIALIVNLERLAPALLPKLDEAMGQLEAQLEAAGAGAAGAEAAHLQNAQRITSLYADAVRSVLESGRAAVIGLSLDAEAVALTKALHVKRGSPLASRLQAGDTSAAREVLARLPDQPFIFAMGVDMQALGVGGMVAAMFEALPAEQDNPLTAMYRLAQPMVEQTQAAGGVLYAPNEATMMGGGFLRGVNLYRVADARQFVAAHRQYIEQLNDLSVAVGEASFAGGPAPQMTFMTTYTPNALPVGDVQVDQYQVNMTVPPDVMQQMGQAGSMMMMGGMNYGGYVAAADANHVIVTTSPDLQLLRQALATVEEGTGIGSAGTIAQLRDPALPPGAAFEGYLSLQGIGQAANLFATLLGTPAINVPHDVPPVAMGVGIDDPSMAGRLYIPTRTVRTVTDLVAQFGAALAPQGGPDAMPPGGAPPY